MGGTVKTLRIVHLREGIPPPIWEQLRRGFVFAHEVSDTISGRRDQLLPPARLRVRIGHVGAEDFVALGATHLRMFYELGGLRPENHVLEVGCGCGRLARAFTTYLNASGSYDGVDIDREAIGWCQQAFRSFPRFHFQELDVFNAFYNPKGPSKASEVSLPFENETFDFAIMTSVLTHLLPEDVPNYLREVSRVLNHGGKAWITYFLWNEKAAEAERLDPKGFLFPDQLGPHRVMHIGQPELGLCLEQRWLLAEYARAQLTIGEVRPGSWRGLKGATDFQDTIIATKP